MLQLHYQFLMPHFLQINTISKILKVFNVQKVLKMRMLLNEMFQSLQYLVNLVPFIIDRLLILASMDTIRGTINYYDVAQVPLENTTKFCSIPGEDLIKFIVLIGLEVLVVHKILKVFSSHPLLASILIIIILLNILNMVMMVNMVIMSNNNNNRSITTITTMTTMVM